jgi:hypothetical protein
LPSAHFRFVPKAVSSDASVKRQSISEIRDEAGAASVRFIPSAVNNFRHRTPLESSRFAFIVNECPHVDLTTRKKSLGFPKFEVGHIHSRARCTRNGLSDSRYILMISTPPSPPVADRVKILTSQFPNDAHLKAWAARLIAAADELQRNKRPDPVGGFVLK